MNTSTKPAVDFADLEDASEWSKVGVKPAVMDATAAAVAKEFGGHTRSQAPVALFDCDKCSGSGRVTFGYVNVRVGKCFRCHGTGKLRTSPEVRRLRTAKAADRKAKAMRNASDSAKSFLAARLDVCAWFKRQEDRGQQFGMDLQAKLYQYGSLTAGQLAAIERSIVRDAEYDAAKAQQVAERAAGAAKPAMEWLDIRALPSGRYVAPGTDVKLNVDNLTADAGKWQGWVFVKRPDKSKVGAQRPGSRYNGQHEAELRAILADPQAASIAFGRLTGTCGVCGRRLDNPDSIKAGIGPICAGKF